MPDTPNVSDEFQANKASVLERALLLINETRAPDSKLGVLDTWWGKGQDIKLRGLNEDIPLLHFKISLGDAQKAKGSYLLISFQNEPAKGQEDAHVYFSPVNGNDPKKSNMVAACPATEESKIPGKALFALHALDL